MFQGSRGKNTVGLEIQKKEREKKIWTATKK
jgi:hypothetical protein